MFKLNHNEEYKRKINEPVILNIDDEVYFGKDVLERKTLGAKLVDTVPVKAKVISIGYVQHRKQAIYLLKDMEDEKLPPFFIYEKNLLKYGAFLKGEEAATEIVTETVSENQDTQETNVA